MNHQIKPTFVVGQKLYSFICQHILHQEFVLFIQSVLIINVPVSITGANWQIKRPSLSWGQEDVPNTCHLCRRTMERLKEHLNAINLLEPLKYHSQSKPGHSKDYAYWGRWYRQCCTAKFSIHKFSYCIPLQESQDTGLQTSRPPTKI